ncbi:putative mitogen-activated protein kinase, putative,kinase [Trypanosoma theileri]|uniref:cyclin-dependent kinase n=1 Tax=Trypanosoma theileri TaxID=67003 RepID=A0A1X0NTI4_9TRYP|nr:putative mitogen-activated protein kinase, putative,kinase [Trypanosoma theileri]ORC87420.1 putative mitogen-activated protein kinase, putative,kinase [Trypanosoma theileri]
MEGYETLGVLGEGTYGVVVKARHRATGRLVAIKKYKQAEDDDHVRKTSLREIRVLKQLRHPNVISLLDVFRRDGKLYLVFEYVENTILQLIEEKRHGLPPEDVRRYTYQLLNGVDYCHAHNIIHRDVKPENILVSKEGLLKLCDFGFARQLSSKGKYTDYVATRWYRAPELLVGDVSYGKAVDVWAIGCIFSELSDGQPLFPGESDLDQLSLILRTCGPVPNRMVDIFEHNSLYRRVMFPSTPIELTLRQRFHKFPEPWLEFLTSCLRTDPAERPSCAALMNFPYFTEDNFRAEYEVELRRLFQQSQQGLKSNVEPQTVSSPLSLHSKGQPLGTELEEGGELMLPLLTTVSPSGGMEANDGSSMGNKSSSLVAGTAITAMVGGGGGGGNASNSVGVGGNSSSSVVGVGVSGAAAASFQQLGTLWNHYLGSTVGSSTGNTGELPNIASRQHQPYQNVSSPMRNGMKNTNKSENKGSHEMFTSPVQTMKYAGGGHAVNNTMNPSSPSVHKGQKVSGINPSTPVGGRGNRKGIGNVNKSGQSTKWKSGSLKKQLKLNYPMFPALPSDRSSPVPAPYNTNTTTTTTNTTTTSSVALNALSVIRDGNTSSVQKLAPNNTHANTGQTTNTTHTHTTSNVGAGNSTASNNVTKHKKKQNKRAMGPGGVKEASPGGPGNNNSYNNVSGQKYSFQDAPSKR